MKNITLGKTGICVPQNGFGALPIQRISEEAAVEILRRAYDGGIRFFDTARAYSDSEEKLGAAFENIRDDIFIASKTMATTPEEFWEQLETTLKNLRTDHLDLYQLHCVKQCYRPGDGTGMYECMLEAKEKGLIDHIGITAHLLSVAQEIVESGLYETLQFPLSYLSSEKELQLVDDCEKNDIGFIAMKGLAGGLLTDSEACMAFMQQFENVIPIWGVQKMSELEEWLAFMDNTPVIDDRISEVIERDRRELAGEFCRGCGYCMPCPAEIKINSCARMSLMLRRAPSEAWLTPEMQDEMKKIENCTHCGSCMEKCPYSLDTPSLLEKNYEDYKKVLAGEVQV